MTEIDLSRAILNEKDTFRPFYVEYAVPLQKALSGGRVREDTPVLVMERDVGSLALLTEQMAYHHVAQGELAGEPWLVSF